MSLADVPGQARTKRFLLQLLKGGHVPHALLFSGMAGIGKAALALEFAKLLNCRSREGGDSCNVCSSCHKMESGTHPDLVVVRRDGIFIKLDQIRELKERLRFRPFEGLTRVIIIENAQDLKEEAANALLKILEEPPKQNIFILTAVESRSLLPTIISRCCHIRMQPLEPAWIERHLTEACGLPAPRAREVAELAEGSLERAKWLVEENRIAQWQEVVDRLQRLGELSMVEFFALMAQWVQKSEDLEQDLECIKLWVREVLLARLMGERPSAFVLDAAVLRLACAIPVDGLFGLYDRVEQAVQQLRRNTNKQLTLEGVCLAIKDGLYGQGRWHSLSQGGQSLSL